MHRTVYKGIVYISTRNHFVGDCMFLLMAAFRSRVRAEVLLIHIDLVFKEICLPIGQEPKFVI